MIPFISLIVGLSILIVSLIGFFGVIFESPKTIRTVRTIKFTFKKTYKSHFKLDIVLGDAVGGFSLGGSGMHFYFNG